MSNLYKENILLLLGISIKFVFLNIFLENIAIYNNKCYYIVSNF